MTDAATGTRTVVVEREIPHPPEKIWRALTQPHLIEEWRALYVGAAVHSQTP